MGKIASFIFEDTVMFIGGSCEWAQLGICGKMNGKDTILDINLVVEGVKSIWVKKVGAKTAEINKKRYRDDVFFCRDTNVPKNLEKKQKRESF